MKKITFLLINWIIVLWLPAQNQDWEVYIGTSTLDESPSDILEYYDKGYVLAAGNDNHGMSIKTGINGNALYTKYFSHNNAILRPWAVAADSAGNVYFTGPIFINNTSWPFVIKFDSCGEKLWCRNFPDYQCHGGGAMDVLINENNEIILLAEYTDDIGPANVYLIGMSEDGDVLWKRHYAKKENYPLMVNPVPYDLLELNNEYYIAGYCYYPFPNNPNHVYLRPLFIGIDNEFKEKWVLPFYKLDSIFGWAERIIPLNDSVIMGVGIRKYYDNQDYSLLAFFKTNGEELGYNQITNEQIGTNILNNYIQDIKRINETQFLAAAPFGTATSLNPIGEFIIDTAANLYNFHSRPNTQSKPRMVKTFDNNFVISTNIKTSPTNWDIYLFKINANLESVPFDTSQRVYDSLCPHTIQSGTVDLTDCLVVTSIHDAPSPEQYYESIRWIPIKVFPNPVKEGKVTFEFENTDHHPNMELRVYNIFGSEISRQRIYRSQQAAEMDVTAWLAGIYLAVIFSNGGAVGRVKFVVE